MLEELLAKSLANLNSKGWNVYNISETDQNIFDDPVARGPVTQLEEGAYLVLPQVPDPRNPVLVNDANRYMQETKMLPIAPQGIGAVPLIFFSVIDNQVTVHVAIDEHRQNELHFDYTCFELLTSRINRFVRKTREELLEPRIETFLLEKVQLLNEVPGARIGTVILGSYAAPEGKTIPGISQLYEGLTIERLQILELRENRTGKFHSNLIKYVGQHYTVTVDLRYMRGGNFMQMSAIGDGNAETSRRLYDLVHKRIQSSLDLKPLFIAHSIPDHMLENQVKEHFGVVKNYLTGQRSRFC